MTPYEAGYNAYFAADRSNNPYPEESKEYEEWDNGYCDADCGRRMHYSILENEENDEN